MSLVRGRGVFHDLFVAGRSATLGIVITGQVFFWTLCGSTDSAYHALLVDVLNPCEIIASHLLNCELSLEYFHNGLWCSLKAGVGLNETMTP